MKVNSSITNQIQRLKRYDLLSEMLLFFLKAMYAETPDKNTKVGADRCVTHLVMKSNVVVV